MRFPKSELNFDIMKAADGKRYTLNFYGEDEGAAVVTHAVRPGGEKLRPVEEVHREAATDVADARRKLEAWCKAQGWTFAP